MSEATEKPDRDSLKALVAYIKPLGLTGKAREDATAHFLAGVSAAGGGDMPGAKYIDVLEELTGE